MMNKGTAKPYFATSQFLHDWMAAEKKRLQKPLPDWTPNVEVTDTPEKRENLLPEVKKAIKEGRPF